MLTIFVMLGGFSAGAEFPDERFQETMSFDSDKIVASLNLLKSAEKFPPLYPDGKVHVSENKTDTGAIPSFVLQRFLTLNLHIFGKKVFELKACKGCEPNIEIGNLVVYMDPDWIQNILQDPKYKNAELLIEFILAHELSHYVYEWTISNSSNHLSPNGQQSYWLVRLHNLEFVNSLFGLPEGQDKNFRLREAIFEETSRHAEMDAIAMTILSQMGRPKPCDALTWLRGWTSVPADLVQSVGGAAYLRVNTVRSLLSDSCR